MWLLIDDVRDLNTDAIARTPEAGQRLLASGPWACLCLNQIVSGQTTFDFLLRLCYLNKRKGQKEPLPNKRVSH